VLFKSRRQKLFAACSCVVLLAAGCGAAGGKPAPEVVPVEGTVMYNGQPVAGATVSFHHEKAPRVASGVTDAEGKFQLSMLEANDGAMPGDNAITVTKVEAGAAPVVPPSDDPAVMAQMYQEHLQGTAPKGPKDLLPSKYANQATSGLKETVKQDGENKFVLQLTD
jgi:hypothetical protein